MKILKRIQILVFCLIPSFLFGMEKELLQDSLQYGSWTIVDKTGKSVIIEGGLISNESKIIDYYGLKNLGMMNAEIMSDVDWIWLKAYPYAFFVLLYKQPSIALKIIKGLFKRNSFRNIVRDLIYEGYCMEINEICESKCDNMLSYIFTASEFEQNGNRKLLGSVIFSLYKNEINKLEFEVNRLTVKPEAQGRGLCTILMSGIFKIFPQTERLYLNVNKTNDKAIKAYEALGFVKSVKRHSTGFSAIGSFDYEYLTDNCRKLQTVAENFV